MTASRWVRLPQVNGIVASGDVALWLAESGGVGTCFGTGSPGLLHEGGLVMAIPIEDDFTALKVDGTVVGPRGSARTLRRQPGTRVGYGPVGALTCARSAFRRRKLVSQGVRMLARCGERGRPARCDAAGCRFGRVPSRGRSARRRSSARWRPRLARPRRLSRPGPTPSPLP
jgi:hypothetical protein